MTISSMAYDRCMGNDWRMYGHCWCMRNVRLMADMIRCCRHVWFVLNKCCWRHIGCVRYQWCMGYDRSVANTEICQGTFWFRLRCGRCWLVVFGDNARNQCECNAYELEPKIIYIIREYLPTVIYGSVSVERRTILHIVWDFGTIRYYQWTTSIYESNFD